MIILRMPTGEEDLKCKDIVDGLKKYNHPEVYSGAYKAMFNLMVKGDIDLSPYLSEIMKNWTEDIW